MSHTYLILEFFIFIPMHKCLRNNGDFTYIINMVIEDVFYSLLFIKIFTENNVKHEISFKIIS